MKSNRSEHSVTLRAPTFVAFSVVCLVLPLAFSFQTENTFELPKVAFLVFGLGLVASLWLLSAARRRRACLLTTRLDLPLMLLAGAYLLSFAGSPLVPQGLRALADYLLRVSCFYVALHVLATRRQIHLAATLLFVAAVGQAAYGILQYVGVDPVFGEFTETVAYESRMNAVIGTLGYKNYVGGFLALLAPLGVFVIARARRVLHKVVAALGLGIVIAAVVLCRTRGAWLGLVAAAALLAFAFLWPRLTSRKLKLTIVVLVAATLAAGAYAGVSRARGKAATIIERRLLIWRTTLTMARHNPVTGVGAGMFGVRYLEFLGRLNHGDPTPETVSLAENVKESHNEYLQTLAELGLVGLLALGFLVGRILTCLLARLRNVADPSDRVLILSVAAGVVAVLVHSALSFPLRVIPTSHFFWAAIAIAYRLRAHHEPKLLRERRLPGRRPVLVAAALFVLLAGSLVAVGLVRSDTALAEAKYLAFVGQRGQALREYERIGIRLLFDQRARFHYGSALLVAGRVDEGIAQLERAKAGYSDINMYLNLGRAYLEKGDCDKSAEQYAFAAATGIRHVACLNDLGVVRMRQGRPKDAKALFLKALRLDPDDHASCHNLGTALMALGDYDSAIESLSRARRLRETAAVNDALAMCYIRKGAHEQAIPFLKRNLAIEATPVRSLNNLGFVYMQMGQTEKALEQWRKALEYEPSNAVARKNIEAVTADRGRYEVDRQ